jgi:asparagine synthase (glutamine-hydrolysing)
MTGYLPNDLLVKVDRASMACGLEAREPLLDESLAQLAFSLPNAVRIRGGRRKWVLRRVLERRVPRELLDRPKQGFAVPLAAWLRGPLRSWGEDLLAEGSIRAAGFLDVARVRAISDGAAAWNLLMFEAWRRRWGH